MRVVIDARPLSHPQHGGFRSSVRALVRGLRQRVREGGSDDIEILLYLDRPLPDEYAALLPPGAQVRLLSPNRLRTDLRLFLDRVRRDAPDLVHGTQNYLPPGLGVPTVVTIHDALGLKRHPWDAKHSLRGLVLRHYWATMTRRAARVARNIVTDSHGAAAELAGALRLAATHFTIVPVGVALPPPCPDGPRSKETVLAIASPDPRKNFDGVVTAWQKNFPGRRPPRLAVVCSNRRAADRVSRILRGVEGVDLCIAPDDQTVRNAYARATVFVWPSLYEGFGLPPLEAMASGCPVVSSSAPTMPEILGDGPVYFDPARPGELADLLAALLADPNERSERSRRGRAHAATFTCRRMADETVAVWRRVLGA
jgi:glycosyltransferase involved in cell wall biosynthesis